MLYRFASVTFCCQTSNKRVAERFPCAPPFQLVWRLVVKFDYFWHAPRVARQLLTETVNILSEKLQKSIFDFDNLVLTLTTNFWLLTFLTVVAFFWPFVPVSGLEKSNFDFDTVVRLVICPRGVWKTFLSISPERREISEWIFYLFFLERRTQLLGYAQVWPTTHRLAGKNQKQSTCRKKVNFRCINSFNLK